MKRIILASQSPRRRQLINLLHCPVTAVSADVDESQITTADPGQNAIDTARLKAETILAHYAAAHDQSDLPAHCLLVAADTTVALGRQLLGKPSDAAAATHTLRQLRRQRHTVYTGMVVVDMSDGRMVTDVTSVPVTMRNYSDAEIAAYVASGDPLDKAGAYAVQHPTFQPVAHLAGCYLGVMGLSICHLLRLLHRLDAAITVDRERLRQAHNGYACPYLA